MMALKRPCTKCREIFQPRSKSHKLCNKCNPQLRWLNGTNRKKTN